MRIRDIPVEKRIAALGMDDVANLEVEQADKLAENVIGVFSLPLCVAEHFVIDGKHMHVPMVTEEPSVVAAASAGAKAVLGGIRTSHGQNMTRGQIQIINPNPDAATKIHKYSAKIEEAAKLSERMRICGISYTKLSDSMGKVELDIDTGQAMGANAVNTVCESVSDTVGELTGGRVGARILSNYHDSEVHMVEAVAEFPHVPGLLDIYEFAKFDVFRAVTHNKGVMNGVTAVALATGQDTRAIEASCHAFAGGGRRPLTKWYLDSDDNLLHGQIKLPIRVGTVGGLTVRHPMARSCLKMLGNPSVGKLAAIMASAGLCANYSAMRALATDGIQKGHMRLHSRRLEP